MECVANHFLEYDGIIWTPYSANPVWKKPCSSTYGSSVTKVTDNCLPNGGSSIVLIGDTNMIILGWRSTATTQACSPQHPAPSPLVLLSLISFLIMSHHSHPPVHVFWLLHALLPMYSKLLSLHLPCIFQHFPPYWYKYDIYWSPSLSCSLSTCTFDTHLLPYHESPLTPTCTCILAPPRLVSCIITSTYSAC